MIKLSNNFTVLTTLLYSTITILCILNNNNVIASASTTTAKPSLKTVKYEKLMNHMNGLDNDALLDALKSAGYAQANLGSRRDLTFQKKKNNNENDSEEKHFKLDMSKIHHDEEFPNQFTFGHSCHTVDLKMTTQHMQDKGAKIITTDDADLNGVDDKENDNTVLLETNEKIVLNKKLLRKMNNQAQGKLNAKMDEIMQLSSSLSAGAQTNLETQNRVSGGPGSTDLDCECRPYECHCHKQCFCRLSVDPFAGTHFPPEANCPICPVCTKPSKNAPQKGKGATKNAEQDFKCSCNLEGVGGPGISEGGYMECDCKVADCTCEKTCQCKKTGSGFSFKSKKDDDGKTIKINEKDIKHGEEVHKKNSDNKNNNVKKDQQKKQTEQPRFQETKVQEASSTSSASSNNNNNQPKKTADTSKKNNNKEQKIEDVIYG